MYLECSSHAEDAIVRIFRRQALERKLYHFTLFRDQVVGSVYHGRVSAIFWPQNSHERGHWRYMTLPYFRPSFRYPALLKYHSDNGCIHRRSQGRFMMKGANDGADILGVSR